MKKFRRSPFTIACYVIAAMFAAYFVTIIISTVTTINQYYAAYDMSPTFGEVASYLFQQGTMPLFAAIGTFMAGIILDEVRKGNPANWASDEEISEAKEAKRLAKEAKQIAKGEAAAAAATAASAAEKIVSDESIKPEFAAVVAEESKNTVVFDDEEDAEAADEAEAAVEEKAEEAAGAEEKAEDAAGAAAAEAEEKAEVSDVFEVEVAEDAEEK
ncbi:MAG: hypothetical protein J6D57_00295 [Mogibacterium sp.]|nr:hypothetical protein [Mogibacterium sp.]